MKNKSIKKVMTSSLMLGASATLLSAVSCNITKKHEWDIDKDKKQSKENTTKINAKVEFKGNVNTLISKTVNDNTKMFTNQVLDSKEHSDEVKNAFKVKFNKIVDDLKKYGSNVDNLLLNHESLSIDEYKTKIAEAKSLVDVEVNKYNAKFTEFFKEFKNAPKLNKESNDKPTEPEIVESEHTTKLKETLSLFISEYSKQNLDKEILDKYTEINEELKTKKFTDETFDLLVNEKIVKELQEYELKYHLDKHIKTTVDYESSDTFAEELLKNTFIYKEGIKLSLSDKVVLEKVLKGLFGHLFGEDQKAPINDEDKLEITFGTNGEPQDNKTWIKPDQQNNIVFIPFGELKDKILKGFTDGDKPKILSNGLFLNGMIYGQPEESYSSSSDSYTSNFDKILRFVLFRENFKNIINTMKDNGSFLAANGNLIEYLKQFETDDLINLHYLTYKSNQPSFIKYIEATIEQDDAYQNLKLYSNITALEKSHFTKEALEEFYLIKLMQKLTINLVKEINDPKHNQKFLPLYDKINDFMSKLAGFLNNGTHDQNETFTILEEFKTNYGKWLELKTSLENGASNDAEVNDGDNQDTPITPEQDARNKEYQEAFKTQIEPLKAELSQYMTEKFTAEKTYLEPEKQIIADQIFSAITKLESRKEANNITEQELQEIKTLQAQVNGAKQYIETQISTWEAVVAKITEGDERMQYIESLTKIRKAFNLYSNFSNFIRQFASQQGNPNVNSVQMDEVRHIWTRLSNAGIEVSFMEAFYDLNQPTENRTFALRETPATKEELATLYDKIKELLNAEVKTFNKIMARELKSQNINVDESIFHLD